VGSTLSDSDSDTEARATAAGAQENDDDDDEEAGAKKGPIEQLQALDHKAIKYEPFEKVRQGHNHDCGCNME